MNITKRHTKWQITGAKVDGVTQQFTCFGSRDRDRILHILTQDPTFTVIILINQGKVTGL
jgi:hypothetical protein